MVAHRLCLLSSLCLAACRPPSGPPPTSSAQLVPAQPPGPSPEALQLAQIERGKQIEQLRLDPGLRLAGEAPLALQTLIATHDRRPQLSWVTDPQRLDALRDAIGDAHRHGLDPARYHLDLLTLDDPEDPQALAAIDLLAMDAFLALAAHYHSGRIDPVTLDPEWHARREALELASTTDAAADDPASALQRYLPPDPGYARLVAAYDRLRSAPEPPPIGPGDELARPASGERVSALIARLAALGGLEGAPTSYDASVEQAVRQLQHRMALPETGIVDRGTQEALDVPLRERARTVGANLERWRWLPQELGQQHVRVNIAAFELRAFEDGQLVQTHKVIVGRDQRHTPVFSETLRTIVFNPTWNVPSGIRNKDILPKLRADPSALERMGLTVLRGSRVVDPSTVDWSSPGDVRFRQPPGPNNALGQMKFLFPNRFAVYLHDTPSRELFSQTRRDFSAGCVRVEDPLALAAWILRGVPGWDRAQIDAVVAAGEEHAVEVPTPIQVHLQYATAWVDAHGALHLRDDIYGRDAPLIAALDAPPPDGP